MVVSVIDLLREDESAPSSWPAAPSGLSTDAAAIDSDAIWQRIESFIAYRWQERTVEWIVQGPGVFVPRLKPATIGTREIWRDGAWQSVTLDPSPLGDELDAETYRISTTVGSTDTPPPAVLEAFRRLAEYLADEAHIGRVPTNASLQLGDSIQITAERPAAWQAKALHYSGAADLLRQWRR